MKPIFFLTALFLIGSALQAQTSTNPVYLNYDSNLDWATYISATGSVSNQPSMFFHLPYVGTTGNAVFEWDADDSGTRKTIYRFETSSDRIFEINGWNDGNSSDLWFGDDNDSKFYIADDGHVGIGTNSPLEKFQIGNRWTFHNGGHKIIGYNFNYDSGNKRIFQDEVSLMRFTDYGDIRFEHAVSDTANSTISDWAKSLTLKNDGRVGVGTDSPSANLHVSSSTSGDAIFKVEADTDNNNESDNARVAILQDGGAHGAYIGYNSDWSGIDSDNRFRIVTRRSGTNDEEAFVIKTTNSGSVTSSFVGIGTSNPSKELEVNGTIRSKEVIVEATNWPDYVFEEDYDLPTLSEIEAFIKANKHLPEVPSAKEMEANGISIGEMNMLLLKKIEELTLHTIEQERALENKQQKLKALEVLVNRLVTRIELLEQKK